MTALKKCAGGFPGPCDNEPGTPWSPLWCEECNQKRLDHISDRFAQIAETFAPAPIEEVDRG